MRLATPEGHDPAPSRRAIAASLFTASYALAAAPALGQAIVTPTDRIATADVRFPAHGGYELPAYVARPKTRVRAPAIIVVNEIFGIHAYIKDVCHRFANEGFVAIAPDYFDRAGDPAQAPNMEQIRPIVAAARYDQVMGDTEGAIAWLERQNDVDREKIGVTGFCWGGSVVWMAAAHFADVKAGVAWYGRLVAPPAGGFGAEAGRPWPADVAAQLRAPVLGLYAANDQGIPPSSVEAMRSALAANGNPTHSEIVVYLNTQHGFHADYRPSYNAEAAHDGWTRALAWFRTHGVG
jgi:carboxymethylenebutenolidase